VVKKGTKPQSQPKLEYLLRISDVCALLPEKIRPTKATTIAAWTKRGVRGVILRSVIVGRMRCTTKEWVDDFIAEVTAVINKAQAAPARRIGRPAIIAELEANGL